jgi:hypothetical protein
MKCDQIVDTTASCWSPLAMRLTMAFLNRCATTGCVLISTRDILGKTGLSYNAMSTMGRADRLAQSTVVGTPVVCRPGPRQCPQATEELPVVSIVLHFGLGLASTKLI